MDQVPRTCAGAPRRKINEGSGRALSPGSADLLLLRPNPMARRLHSERFRSLPRTCGRFRGILSLR